MRRTLDSGANAHLVGSTHPFAGMVRQIAPAIHVAGIGKARLRAVAEGLAVVTVPGGVKLQLDGAYYVPGLQRTLVSISRLVEDGWSCLMAMRNGVNCATVWKGQERFEVPVSANGMYEYIELDANAQGEETGCVALWEQELRHDDDAPAGYVATVTGGLKSNTYFGDISLEDLIHRRCGHVSWGNRHWAGRLRAVFGSQAGKGHVLAACESCMKAKMTAIVSRKTPTRPATRPLGRIHFDLSGRIPVEGVGGEVAFLLIVDEFTGMIIARMIRSKAEVAGILADFKVLAETHFRERVGEAFILAGMRSDRESVNLTGEVKEWCKANGIHHELSAAYSQWQNGIVERGMRTVWEGAEAMRKDAGAPIELWPYALQAFVFTYNMLSLGESEQSPYEKWWSIQVPLERRMRRLRIWGSKAYAFIPKALRKKGDDKAKVCVHLGYSNKTNGYVLMELTTGKVFEATSVAFDETRKPFVDQNVGGGDGDLGVQMNVWSASPASDADEKMEAVDADELGATGEMPFSQRPLALPSSPPALEPRGQFEELLDDEPSDHVSSPHALEQRSQAEGTPGDVLTDQPQPPALKPYSQFEELLDDMPSDQVPSPPNFLPDLEPFFPPVDAESSEDDHSDMDDVDDDAEERKGVINKDVRDMQASLRKRIDDMDRHTRRILRTERPLRADLAGIPAQAMEENLGVGVNGEVFVPIVDEHALDRYNLERQLDGPAMCQEDLDKLAERIKLLAMVARVPPKALEVQPPASYLEAARDVSAVAWKEAMDAEMANMKSFGVWKLVPPPPGANVMKCKWVYAIKRDAQGELDKLKARLTCKGFTQREGVDFGATWAPTCRMRVFRMMMAEASSDTGIQTAQWDCTSAFLHADVDYDMYMEQPEGYEEFDEGGEVRLVCKLLKAIYGCKQSSRLFHQVVRGALLSFGATQASADECLFIFKKGKSWLKVLVHVDDFACTFNDRRLYDDIFAQMQGRFKITDYGGGPITRFIGVCVERTDEGHYRLHQKQYIDQILSRLRLSGVRHAASPERGGTASKLRPQVGPLSVAEAEFMKRIPYREAVGALFYLARSTRWDISHACGQVARFMSNPNPGHWAAVVRIYAYLARTKDVALLMRSRGMKCEMTNQFLEGFSDSDWAGCQETRKSHTGWMIMVGGSLVAWYSRRQTGIAQSTTEAEYVAAGAAANEVIWWRRLCTDLGYDADGAVTVWCDNRAASLLADHEGRFDAAKHIQIRFHVLRQYQKQGLVNVQWRQSAKMWADVLTKNCTAKHFRALVSKIMGEQV